ncbi:serine hydrolase domain-containing protein [Glutamicibacter endophyticus]|uniref:serine hydrolase domain-containing protein n=1 Tax=Glutamicibacter endophyticus TaxID=1522174 RepID=UPI003AF08103
MNSEQPVAAVTAANWQLPENIRYSFQNLADVLPTVKVSRGDDHIAKLPRTEMDLGSIQLPRSMGEPSMTVRGVMNSTDTDAWLVMQDGRILTEKYLEPMTALTDHLLMSVSKTLVGTVAGTLVDAGKLDVNAPVTDYVPALSRSGYNGATVRHLLDMRSGIKYSEEYLDPAAEVRLLEQAIGWAELEGDMKPIGLYDYLLTLKAEGPHGGPFDYRSCETDVLGWVCEAAGGARMQQLLSENVWAKIGAQQDLVMGVDQFDTGMFDGGFNSTLRDLARFGHLFINNGISLTGERVVSEAWLADVFTEDEELVEAFAASPGDNMMPGGHYRNQIWFPYPGTGVALALGIHGQMIYMNRATGMVGVKLSSWPLPQDAGKLFPTIRAFDAIANHLADLD